MNTNDIKDTLKKHKAWLYGNKQGAIAELRYANLRHANFQGADLRHAVLRHADLRHADLRSSNLRRADLSYADLRYADLRHADLNYASLSGAVGNGIEVKSAHISRYTITWTNTDLAIGCQQHPIEWWKNAADDDIDSMADDTLDWWKKYKDLVFKLLETGE